MGWIVSAVSSGTALAEYTQTNHTRPILTLGGIWWNIMGGGSTASVITIRYGESSAGTLSSLTVAASTGGSDVLDLTAMDLKAFYLAVAATSNLGTSNTVGMWGD